MNQSSGRTGTSRAWIENRRARILEQIDRPLVPVGAGEPALPPDRVDFLVHEAEELYWNELAWEELTDEERVSGGHLTELVFPGFLAFVDGLLLENEPDASFGVSRPHPEIVEDILSFLGERYAEATSRLEGGADSEDLVWARAMTDRLIDLVLYRLYALTQAEREELENRG